ncbi:MAG: hypothetical protein EOP10_22725, partial [Proteobacteria bacterium]
MIKQILILFALLASLSSFADSADSEVLRLHEISHQGKSINDSISVFEDPTGALSFAEVQLKDKAGLFIPRENLHRNGFGFTRSAIWVKSDVLNTTDKHDWIIGSPRPDFAIMDIFIIDSNGALITETSIGTSAPRPIDRRLPAGRIHLKEGEAYTIFIKVQSPLQLSLSFHLLSEDEYLAFTLKESNFFSAYFGTVSALLLYNLFLFIILRYRDYIFYVIFGFAMALNAYIQGGFAEGAMFHLPFLKSTGDAYKIILFPSIASILYTRSFLRLSTVAPRLNRFMGWLAILGAFIAVFLWTDNSFAFRAYASAFDAFAVIFVFVGSIVAIRSGDKTAQVFLLAWGLFAISVSVWVLGNMGVLEKSHSIAISPLVGNMCEMVLMSIALALRIKEIDRKKVQAEMKAREKDNLQHLLRMVCHDISNPLSIIKTVFFLSSRRVNANPEETKQWERVKRASDSIEGIINQVRKYESFRSGKLAFELKPCSLKTTLEDVEFFFQTRAQEKDVQLSCEVSAPWPDIIVMADS